MAYERTWQPMSVQGPRVAVSSADISSYHVWLLAQMLLGRVGTATQGLWSIYYSCDGTTAGTPGDAVDRWGSVYSLASIPNSPAGSGAHGWMVLTRQFTTTSGIFDVYLLLSSRGFGVSGTGRIVITAGLSPATGGSTTADPTIPVVAFGNALQNNSAVDNSTDFTNPRRYYGSVSATGDFWFAETVLGEFTLGHMFFNPVGCKTNDQCPFYGNSANAYTPGGQFPFGGAWLYTRAITSAGGSITTGYNGVASQYPALDAPPTFALLDSSDASIFDKPAFVTIGNSVSPTSLTSRGRLPDIGLSAGVVSPGTPAGLRPVNIGTTIKDPQTLAIMYVTANSMILPYNASIS